MATDRRYKLIGQGLPGNPDFKIEDLADGDLAVWDLTLRKWVPLASSGLGVTDHGALTGLGDDDHTQYHNDARGDLRYPPLARNLTAGAGLAGGGDLNADRSFAVNVQNSIQISSDTLELVGDAASPGNDKLYGTNNAGTKGWYDQPAAGGGTLLTVTSDILSSGAGGTKFNITGLSFSPAASTRYLIEYWIMYESNNVNNGVYVGIDWPGGMNENVAQVSTAFTNALSSDGVFDRAQGGTANFQNQSTATTPANTPMPSWGWAIIDMGGSPTGTFQMTFASEAAGPTFIATIKAGSSMRYVAL